MSFLAYTQWTNPPYFSVGYARVSTGLTLEICRGIVSEVGSRSDLATLCQVSKGFRAFAERALYNTLYMRNVQETLLLCNTLSNTPRIALLVDALTIYATAGEEVVTEDSDSEEEEESSHELPDGYWSSVARALEQTTNLRYLNMHITNSASANVAWTLDNCTFQLKGFHCDLNWDNHLVSFLNKQTKLNDLYLLDYIDLGDPSTSAAQALATESLTSLHPSAFPDLSTLECTFSEAAAVITPSRPITRLKTCFSRTQLPEKRAEMTLLLSKIRQSTRPIRSLDLADSKYTTSFSMELLSSIVNSRATSSELRYLGTLVLPISGREVSGD